MSTPTLPRLLVVDDEPALMATLRDTLREEGYHVTAVESGEAALAILSRANFDLLLTDLVMPAMGGIELIEGAVALDPFLVAIVMTGHGSIPTAVDAMKTGAIDYVLKPIKLTALVPAIERALTLRNLRTRNAELEQKLREHAAKLEAANKDLESFTSSISHDLRTPLRAITGFSEILLDPRSTPLPPDVVRYLGLIQAGAKEMSEMINALLSLSRFGRSALSPVPLDLGSLFSEVFGQLANERVDRRVNLSVQPLPPAYADALLMRQVVTNLLSNAIKYSRPRDPAVIEVGVTRAEGEAGPVYFVRDNGVGFEMRHAKNLFEVFHRMHHADEFEGTGVGLATVRRILDRHGGKIWAESTPGDGATFFFTLPPEPPSNPEDAGADSR